MQIFGAAAACRTAAAVHGEENVVNATIGAVMDDAGKLAHLPTVERVFRSLPIEDYIAYAPIAGLPEYLEAAIDITFAGNGRMAFWEPLQLPAVRARFVRP